MTASRPIADGECIFSDNFKKAQSLRSLAYYLKKTRNLDRNFMFRKLGFIKDQ